MPAALFFAPGAESFIPLPKFSLKTNHKPNQQVTFIRFAYCTFTSGFSA
jgi:hypothetical protein